MSSVRRAAAVVALLAVAVWLGGLIALGALVAPVVFTVVSMPWSADAMTLVFRRFDAVAMVCAAALLASEAILALTSPVRFARVDHLRAGVSLLAAIAVVYEGTAVSPRIATLHQAGAVRGLGDAGIELARLHTVAEACGKIEVVLLALVVVLQVVALTRGSLTRPASSGGAS
jgi:hypothetical protein